MTKKTLGISTELNQYLVENGTPPDEVLLALAEETLAIGELAIMQIAPEQGAFMELLVGLLNPKFCVELGTFTGYSSICVARALEVDAKLLCCDVSDEWTDIAKKYWELAGVQDRIQLELGPGLETLENLPKDQKIDFAFIDADKENYINYYEAILKRLSPNGIILVDNVLWSGDVVNTDTTDSNLQAIKDFNEFVANDPRTKVVIIPIADGLSMITLNN